MNNNDIQDIVRSTRKDIKDKTNTKTSQKLAARKVLEEKVKEREEAEKKLNSIRETIDVCAAEIISSKMMKMNDCASTIGVSRQFLDKRIKNTLGITSMKDVSSVLNARDK